MWEFPDWMKKYLSLLIEKPSAEEIIETMNKVIYRFDNPKHMRIKYQIVLLERLYEKGLLK